MNRRVSMIHTFFKRYGEEKFKEVVGRYFSNRKKFRMYFFGEDQGQYYTNDTMKMHYIDLQHLERESVEIEDFSDLVLGHDAFYSMILGITETGADERKKTEFLSEHHAECEKIKSGSRSVQNMIKFGTIVCAFLDKKISGALKDNGPFRPRTRPPGTGILENIRYKED